MARGGPASWRPPVRRRCYRVRLVLRLAVVLQHFLAVAAFATTLRQVLLDGAEAVTLRAVRLALVAALQLARAVGFRDAVARREV